MPADIVDHKRFTKNLVHKSEPGKNATAKAVAKVAVKAEQKKDTKAEAKPAVKATPKQEAKTQA